MTKRSPSRRSSRSPGSSACSSRVPVTARSASPAAMPSASLTARKRSRSSIISPAGPTARRPRIAASTRRCAAARGRIAACSGARASERRPARRRPARARSGAARAAASARRARQRRGQAAWPAAATRRKPAADASGRRSGRRRRRRRRARRRAGRCAAGVPGCQSGAAASHARPAERERGQLRVGGDQPAGDALGGEDARPRLRLCGAARTRKSAAAKRSSWVGAGMPCGSSGGLDQCTTYGSIEPRRFAQRDQRLVAKNSTVRLSWPQRS